MILFCLYIQKNILTKQMCFELKNLSSILLCSLVPEHCEHGDANPQPGVSDHSASPLERLSSIPCANVTIISKRLLGLSQ